MGKAEMGRGALGLISAFCFLLSTFALVAGEVKLAWDASASPNVTYQLYAHTNSLAATNLAPAVVAVNVGTNLAVTADIPTAGLWYFRVTARNGTAESAPSGEVIAQVPAAPANARTIALQNTVTLTNGWNNVGFFRLLIQ